MLLKYLKLSKDDPSGLNELLIDIESLFRLLEVMEEERLGWLGSDPYPSAALARAPSHGDGKEGGVGVRGSQNQLLICLQCSELIGASDLEHKLK